MTQATDLDPILNGAAVARLDDRAFLRITGSDATRWLNGMVTNSIQALQPGEGCYNFLLNAQGRIQGDCMIYRDPEGQEASFYLLTSRTQLETIQALMEKFIIMDDVELVAADYYANDQLLLLGPDARRVLGEIENPLLSYDQSYKNLKPARLAFYGLTANPLVTPPQGAVVSFEITSESKDALLEEAVEAGAIEVSPEILEAFRIYEGRPKFGVDIRDKDLPQETNQAHALHFNKGCYLGQEIVERIRSRGQVHRLLTRFTLEGEFPAELPAPLESGGKPAGEITSAAKIGDTIYALGYARREFLETKAPFSYPNGTATPRPASK